MLQKVLLLAMILAIPLTASAGLVWQCDVTGLVLSAPKLSEDKKVVFLFKGKEFSTKNDSFCADRVGEVTEVSISEDYYKNLGSPGAEKIITLREFKEENDLGYGLMQWRYFDLSHNE